MLIYKVAQVFPKVAQKETTVVFTKELCFSYQPKKSSSLLATFWRKYFNNTFKNSPNLVILDLRFANCIFCEIQDTILHPVSILLWSRYKYTTTSSHLMKPSTAYFYLLLFKIEAGL